MKLRERERGNHAQMNELIEHLNGMGHGKGFSRANPLATLLLYKMWSMICRKIAGVTIDVTSGTTAGLNYKVARIPTSD